MTSVISLCAHTADLHQVSRAEETERLFVVATEFLHDFVTRIFEYVSPQGFHSVVLPGMRLAVGTVTGQAGLHSCLLVANVADHLLFPVFK